MDEAAYLEFLDTCPSRSPSESQQSTLDTLAAAAHLLNIARDLVLQH